ncbi:MAG: PocR ligand-binding domain-containing protein, partial [Chthoniobacteraceae bacterium]
MKDHAESNARTLQVLSESEMYQDYQRAFTEGTGLPLSLHRPEMLQMVHYAKKNENPFCTIMAKVNQSCAACYAMQCELEAEAQLEPKTLKCFAGLCETAVPVRVGENLIAFLQTGQILLQRPDKARFSRVAATLLKWGAEVDVKKLEEAYFNTRVLTPKQYEALIRLLDTFAKHLASCSGALVLHTQQIASPAIGRARSFIEDHSDEELSLTAVAQAVNMSATYFSEKFKEVAGINFVDYVARTRIEKARNLLQNPNLRISEIAFEVGFQSLSQFNRAFKQVIGEAPRDHRAK